MEQSPYDYRAVVERLEGDQWKRTEQDCEAIMALLGYEVAPHGRLGLACRPIGDSHWQSLPSFRSADDAELWIIHKNKGAQFNDIGIDEDGVWYVSLDHPEYGNDYGNSPRMGTAMWAAFVRLFGKVGGDDD